MRNKSFFLPGFVMLSLWLPTAWSNLALLLVLIAVISLPEIRRRVGEVCKHPWVWGSMAFWLLLAISSTYSLASINEDVDRLLKYKEFLWLPFFAALYQGEKEKNQAIAGFLIGATLVLGISYAGYFGLGNNLPSSWSIAKAMNHDDGPLVFKMAITHNFLMGLAVCAFALLALYSKHTMLRMAALLLSVLALINVLLMVNGRTGYLVLLAAFACAFYWRFGYKGIALSAALALPVMLALYQLAPPVNAAIGEGLNEIAQWIEQPEVNPIGSMEMRLNWWAASVQAIESRPWLGYGVGGYEYAYNSVRDPSVYLPNNNPHNQYVLFAVEIGLIGLAAFLAWWITVWRKANAAMRQETGSTKMCIQFVQIVWLSFSAACLVNSFFIDHTEGVLIQAMLGLLAIAHSHSKS